jgi:hypothetical protein
MRRLLGPVLALLIVLGGAGLTSCRPQEARAEVTRADVRALGPGDTLQIITHYRVSLTQAGGVPDGVSVRVALDSAGSPILHQHRVTDSADTARINAANRYGTLRGSSCVAVSRRGLSSTERCVPWTFVRPDQPPAPADSVRVDSVRIVAIRPVGVQLDPDPQNRCRTWYATHPGGNPWVVVNREAIPECTGAAGHPTSAQFCAFAAFADGSTVVAGVEQMRTLGREWAVMYCADQHTAWQSERSG